MSSNDPRISANSYVLVSLGSGGFGRFLSIVFITVISLVGLFQTCLPSTLHHSPVFAGPPLGALKTGDRALELGENVAGHQLVAM